MVWPALLLKEKIVSLAQLRSNPVKVLKGFVRVVSDSKGLKTNGFFLDKKAFEELIEWFEYSAPEFWDEIEKSRKSGRVSSASIERRLGLKS